MEMPSLLCLLVVLEILTSRSLVDAVTCQVDGKEYKVGQKFTIEGSGKCLKYRCSDDGNYYLFKGGCEDEKGRCRDVDEEWTINCVSFKCNLREDEVDGRKFQHYTGDFTEIGCKHRGACYAEDDTWTQNCVTYQCTVARNEDGSVSISKPWIEGGCKDHAGVCKSLGETWEKGCHTYTCGRKDVSGTAYFNKEIAQYGCKADGKCKKEGDTWKKGCFVYQCYAEANEEGRMVTQARVATGGCKKKGEDGCHELGDTVMDECFKYECGQWEDDGKTYYGLQLVEGGCKDWEGECHPLGHVLTTKRCMNYECRQTEKETNGKIRNVFKFDVSGFQCKDMDKECRREDEIFPLKINGTVYSSCSCTMSPYTVRYDCHL